MSILDKKPTKNEKYPFRIIDGQALIIDPSTNVIKLLNGVGTKIWELIDGERTGNEILQSILAEYEVIDEVAKNDLVKFLQELLTGGIITMNNGE
jgi:Coenzyme PQQ synthesis protein D (PqqD)